MINMCRKFCLGNLFVGFLYSFFLWALSNVCNVYTFIVFYFYIYGWSRLLRVDHNIAIYKTCQINYLAIRIVT